MILNMRKNIGDVDDDDPTNMDDDNDYEVDVVLWAKFANI